MGRIGEGQTGGQMDGWMGGQAKRQPEGCMRSIRGTAVIAYSLDFLTGE